jgi:hypothetical protein
MSIFRLLCVDRLYYVYILQEQLPAGYEFSHSMTRGGQCS